MGVLEWVGGSNPSSTIMPAVARPVQLKLKAGNGYDRSRHFELFEKCEASAPEHFQTLASTTAKTAIVSPFFATVESLGLQPVLA